MNYKKIILSKLNIEEENPTHGKDYDEWVLQNIQAIRKKIVQLEIFWLQSPLETDRERIKKEIQILEKEMGHWRSRMFSN